MNKIILIISLMITLNLYSETASFYHDKFNGRKTANGEIFDQNKLTCASNVYKIGTKLKVTNIKNNKSVIVRVNDTSKLYGRSIDLSKSAFNTIGDLKSGIIKVKIEVL